MTGDGIERIAPAPAPTRRVPPRERERKQRDEREQRKKPTKPDPVADDAEAEPSDPPEKGRLIDVLG